MSKTLKNKGMKALSLLLCAVMLFAALPLSALAAQPSVSLDTLLEQLTDYDALYDKDGLVAWYDFFDAKESDTITSGVNVRFANKITGGPVMIVKAHDIGAKVDNGRRAEWTYGDGYLQISANGSLQIYDLYGKAGLEDAFTVSALYAYNDENATPVSSSLITNKYGTDWYGSIARESFTVGGLKVSTSYLAPTALAEMQAMISAYKAHVAEYEMIKDTEGSYNAKDTRIQYLNTCTFRTPSGLTFGDVYYLLNPELESPVERTGSGEAYQAKWYTYLENDDNFYSQWGQGGIVAEAVTAGSSKMTLPANTFAAPYGEASEVSFLVDNRQVSIAKDAENVASENVSATASAGSDLVLLRDTASRVYSVRVYDKVVSETTLQQNHFADIAKFYRLNIFYFLRMPEASRAEIYKAFAGVSLGELTPKTAQAKLDDAIANLGTGAYDYGSLYVTDADGDGVSDLVFSFNAFDKSAIDGALKDTTLTDSLGNSFKIPSDSTWGEGCLQVTGSINLSAFASTVAGGVGDLTLDVMMAHRERGGNGSWTVGPLTFSVNQGNTENDKPVDESYGPISGTYWGKKNWGTDVGWSKGKFLGNTMGVPFHVAVFVDTENDVDEPTYRAGYIRDGVPLSGRADSGNITYTPDASHVNVKLLSGMKANVYAIRLYSKALSSTQLLQNAFADFANLFKLDMSQFDLISAEGKNHVRSAIAQLDASQYDESSAQDAFDKIINELPAALKYDYEAFYVTDVDGDGNSNMIFSWDALGLDSTANSATGTVPSTTIVDKNGIPFTVNSTAAYGEGYLYNGGGNYVLKEAYPMRDVNGTLVNEDLYVDLLMAHGERYSTGNGTFNIGPFSMQLQTQYKVDATTGLPIKESSPIDETYGPVSGTYWGPKDVNGTSANWGTDVYWSKTKFIGNTIGVPFYVGVFVDTEIDEADLAASTYKMSYYRDGAVVKGPSTSIPYVATAGNKLSIFGNTAVNMYAIRMYDMPLSEEQAAQNRFADLMKYYGLNTVSYLTGSAAQRDQVKELLAPMSVGSDMKESVQNKYNAIFAKTTEYKLDDLYLNSKLLFSYNAFDKNAGDAVQSVVDKTGIQLGKVDASAAWMYGDGTLVLGDEKNGGIKLSNILPAAGGYTVQVLMAYRSGARDGMNASANEVIERPVFSFGPLEIRNEFAREADVPVRGTSFYAGEQLIGKADAYTDTETYTGTLLASDVGDVINLTVSVSRSGTMFAASGYRDGALVSTVSGNTTASRDVVIGNYADVEIYAIRVYGTRMGADEIAQNHFADLCNYYAVDLADYNKLTSDRRSALVETFATVALQDTSREDLMRAMAVSLGEQYAAQEKADNFIVFDGYSARIAGTPALRAVFTLRKDAIAALKGDLTVAEVGVVRTKDVNNNMQTGAILVCDENGTYVAAEHAEKIILYNGSAYDAIVQGDGNDAKAGIALSFDKTTLDHYTADVSYQSYVILQGVSGEGDAVQTVLYGDMSSTLFGNSISMQELSTYVVANIGIGSGVLAVQKEITANADALLTEIRSLANLVDETAKTYTSGKDALLESLQQKTVDALARVLRVKEGGAPADQAKVLAEAKAAAKEAETAALTALRISQVNLQVAKKNAAEAYAELVRLCNMLKIAETVTNTSAGAVYATAEELLQKAEATIKNDLSEINLLKAYKARENALTALAAVEDIEAGNYTVNRTFRVLYIADARMEDAVSQLRLIAENIGYDVITAGFVTTKDYSLKSVADASSVSYRKLTGGAWIDVNSCSLSSVLADEEWNAVVVGENPDLLIAEDQNLVASAMAVRNAIRTACPNVSVYWTQSLSRSERAACALYGDVSTHDGGDAARLYTASLSQAAKVASLFDGVLPVATVLENLRAGAYGEYVFTYEDGSCMTELGAYAVGLTMLSKLTAPALDELDLLASGMVEKIEIDWFKEATASAVATPDSVTKPSFSVGTGVHDEENFVIHGVGQSNMANGPYFNWLQTYLMTRNPGKNLVFLNEGIPGESIGGTEKRVDYVIDADPDVIILHHGVVNYMGWWFSAGATATHEQKDAKLAEHEETLRRILKKYQDAGIEVILSCEGTSPGDVYNADPSYNMTLALTKLTAIHLKMANEFPNVIAVMNTNEFFGKLVEADEKAPTTLFNSDFVHFSNPGGVALTYLYSDTVKDLKTESGVEQFFSNTVADVTVNKDGTVTASNAQVTDVVRSGNKVSYTYLANALPLPVNSNYTKIDDLEGITMADVNQEIIRVIGLAEGNYVIKMDDVLLGVFSNTQLAEGVNIAELDTNPAQAQAQLVYDYVTKKGSSEGTLDRLDYCLFTFYGKGFIDREGNFLYNEAEKRYYNDDDLRAYINKNYDKNNTGWYPKAMYDCFKDAEPAASLKATEAEHQAIVNRYTYLAQQAAIPQQHTVEIVPVS